MPSVKPEELTAKNNSSYISTETKEILKLFMAMFSTIQLDRDNKIKDLDTKVREFKAQPQHRSHLTTKSPFSEEEISSLKTKFKAQENTHTTHLNNHNQQDHFQRTIRKT